MNTTRAFLLVIAVMMSWGCKESSEEKPKWLEGVWEGNAGLEHDTTDYKVRLVFDSINSVYQIEYPSLELHGALTLDSTSRNFAKFYETFQLSNNDTRGFGNVILLSELDSSGVLHMQYLPTETYGQLAFGQIERVNPQQVDELANLLISSESEGRIIIDINCDGILDHAVGKHLDSEYFVKITLSPQAVIPRVIEFRFPVGQSDYQDAFCGTEIIMEMEDLDYDLEEFIETQIAGFKRSKDCKGLKLSDGMCDSFHFFWNHEENILNYWRL